MNRGKPKIYDAIAKRLGARFQNLPNGTRLPSERQLVKEFGCTQLTIRRALRLLEQDNRIYKRPSIGSFAGPRPVELKNSGLVGFLFPDEDIFYYKLLAQMERSFFDMGLHPVVHITGSHPVKEDEILAYMTAHSVNALIAVPNCKCETSYLSLHIPVLFLDLFLEKSRIPYVASDDRSGAIAATEYLLKLGHRRIGCIGNAEDPSALRRIAAVRETLNAHDLPLPRNRIRLGGSTREWGGIAASELLQGKQRPTALFCCNDLTAAGVMRYAKGAGIPVPGELSVIGFGDTEVAEDLQITSVNQHPDRMAAAILKNLRLLLAGECVPHRTLIPTDLVIRTSCGTPSGGENREPKPDTYTRERP